MTEGTTMKIVKPVSFDELVARAKGVPESFPDAVYQLRAMMEESNAGETEIALGWLKEDEAPEDFVPYLVIRVKDVR
jgi:hypothetical protein